MLSQNPARRQLFPYPPSRSSPQKVTSRNTPFDSKIRRMTSIEDGPQQQNQVTQVIDFIQNTMSTLSEYEKQFQGRFNTEMTKMAI